jgi:hypothetical protein
MRRAVIACLAVLVLGALPGPAAAQSSGPATHAPLQIYVGMWTTHLRDRANLVSRNDALGISYRHLFAATFINSFDKRAYAAGLQKEFARGRKGVFSASWGGRLGAVYGYDERFLKLAKDSPVLPMAQAYGLLEVGHVGAEFSWTYVVVSVTGSIRF